MQRRSFAMTRRLAAVLLLLLAGGLLPARPLLAAPGSGWVKADAVSARADRSTRSWTFAAGIFLVTRFTQIILWVIPNVAAVRRKGMFRIRNGRPSGQL